MATRFHLSVTSLFSQAIYSTLTPEAISMKPVRIFWDTAPATSILAKLNVLRSVPRHSKVQVPHWTPLFYAVMNKHKLMHNRYGVQQINVS